jgi:hypothetical protein
MPILSWAQEPTPAMLSILRQTMAADGMLNKYMHDLFWQDLRRASNPNVDHTIRVLEANFFYAQEFQKEAWESAKLSYESNRVVKTKRLIELETEMPKRFAESLEFEKGSVAYRNAIAKFDEGMRRNMANTQLILDAAATHQPMRTPQGQFVEVDEELISAVLVNLRSSFQRLRNLLDEDWEPNN